MRLPSERSWPAVSTSGLQVRDRKSARDQNINCCHQRGETHPRSWWRKRCHQGISLKTRRWARRTSIKSCTNIQSDSHLHDHERQGFREGWLSTGPEQRGQGEDRVFVFSRAGECVTNCC